MVAAEEKLIRLLEVLFSLKLESDEKKQILEAEYEITMTESIKSAKAAGTEKWGDVEYMATKVEFTYTTKGEGRTNLTFYSSPIEGVKGNEIVWTAIDGNARLVKTAIDIHCYFR